MKLTPKGQELLDTALDAARGIGRLEVDAAGLKQSMGGWFDSLYTQSFTKMVKHPGPLDSVLVTQAFGDASILSELEQLYRFERMRSRYGQ